MGAEFYCNAHTYPSGQHYQLPLQKSKIGKLRIINNIYTKSKFGIPSGDGSITLPSTTRLNGPFGIGFECFFSTDFFIFKKNYL